MDFTGEDCYFIKGGFMRKKRLADWFEKLGVAFTAGSVLATKGFWLPFCTGILCLLMSLYLTDRN